MTELFAEQWRRCKQRIEEELGEEEASTWLSPLQLEAIGPRRVVLSGIPNGFFKRRIDFQFTPLLKRCLSHSFSAALLETDFQLELRIGKSLGTKQVLQHKKSTSAVEAPGARSSFAGWVEHPSNRLALCAARRVALQPGDEYNPLFIIAGMGMGKTHLLQAVAEEAGTVFPELRIVSETTETFTNDLMDGIRLKRMKTVRERYRGADLLLLDDVDFLQVSQRGQEELLHTFDHVQRAGGQLVFSASQAPRELEGLHPGLRSRLEMGLVVEIASAERELRLQVLREKAKAQGLFLDEELLELLATRIKSGIRSLEGALVRLLAYASLYDEPITTAFVERVAAPFFDKPARLPPSSEAIVQAVCDHYQLSAKTLCSRSRTTQLVHARGVAAYLLRELNRLSYPEIGNLLGGRSHSTIIYAVEKVGQKLKADRILQREIERMRQIVGIEEEPG